MTPSASRSPAIVGNWKLWGTRAQAAEYCDRLLELLPDERRRPAAVGICAPFTALDVCVEKLRGSGVAVYAQNMHQAQSGAFTGEVSAPMLTEIGIDGVVLGHSRAAPVLRRDRPRAPGEGARRAGGRAAADPLRRRDRGRARRRRDRAQAAPPGSGGAREGRVRAAGRGDDRLRADLGDRHRQGRHPRDRPGGDRVRASAGRRPLEGGRRADPRALRRQREARQRGGDPRRGGRRRGAGGRREPRPRRVRAHRGGAAPSSPRRARRLGPRRARSGQRRRAGRHAGLRRALGALAPHDADRLGARRRAARGADGQLRGRPPQPRRRRDRQAGPAAHRRGDRGRLVLRERHAARGLPHRAPAPARARLGGRRARLDGPPARADRAGRARGRARRRDPRFHRRPRHAPGLRRGLRGGGGGVGRRPHRERDRPLLRDGPRQALGPDQARLRRARRRRGRVQRRQRRGRRPGRLRARRDRRVHQADARGGGGAHPRRRQRGLLQLPARPGAAADAERSTRASTSG